MWSVQIQCNAFFCKMDIVNLIKIVVQSYCDMCVTTGETYKRVLSYKYTASTVFTGFVNIFFVYRCY